MRPEYVDVGLVTSSVQMELPADDRPLLDALRRRGLRVAVLPWDVVSDPGPVRLHTLRAAWNSHLQPQEFLTWLEAVAEGSLVLNGAGLIRWNLDKCYLLELAQRGLPVLPTALLTRSDPEAIAEVMSFLPAGDVVLKPRFGANSFGTLRLSRRSVHEHVGAHLARFGTLGGLLVQPYACAVERERERSLVFIGGRFTHALYRDPFGRGATRQTPDNLHSPSDDEVELGEAFLAALPGIPSYARVDLIPLQGRPVLMELELIDPSLFFTSCPPAAERLATLIALQLSR